MHEKMKVMKIWKHKNTKIWKYTIIHAEKHKCEKCKGVCKESKLNIYMKNYKYPLEMLTKTLNKEKNVKTADI